MQRVIVCDHTDAFLFELNPLEVHGLDRREETNGEHSLTVKTTRVLQQGWRVLTLDSRGRWREHVVYGTDEGHAGGSKPIGQYYCVWSLMHDLLGTHVSAMPGTQTPVLAEVALEAALSGTARWGVGTVTLSTTGGASMYDMSGWDALGVLIATWGGELDATIAVGAGGVVSRSVDLYDAQGEQQAKRRFDFGADLKSVRRKVADGPLYCRISPRGKGEETEGGGYGRKITIESVNDGKDWLQNDDVVDAVKLPDGAGGWEYPTVMVENPEIDTPAALKEWGLSVLSDYTTPKVTYTVDAVQAALEGVSVQGVSLGDAVHVVDRQLGFRVSARVVSIETDMLDEMSVKVTLGRIGESITSAFAKLQGDVSTIAASVEAMRSGAEMTDAYMERLIDRLNEEINATGGYWYLVPGQGTRTYDTEVSDPAVGAEASKVVEVKGGTIRIADSKTAQGEWEWDTVFVSGHVAAQLVTAAHLIAGTIGSAASGNYWNLDTGEFRMAASSTIGDRTVTQLLSGVDATITDVDVEYAKGDSATVAPTSGWSTTAPTWESGKYIWQRTATTTAAGTEYSDPTNITGAKGDSGASGKGISSTTIRYGTSDSAATQPTSWSAAAPTSIANGKWLWTRTVTAYTDGTSTTTYSKSYVGTNGVDGQDGTSVTILGSYSTYAELIAAHPTGSDGDAYMVGADLYVWNGAAWEDVGQIQGPQGPAGQDGTSVTITAIEYGTSASASAAPTAWSTTAPTSLSEGTWLWVRTTYSDGGSATTKSYVGTDGEDGKYVTIQSATKVGGTTTVVLAETDPNTGQTTTSTLTIDDGEDGATGTAGANGYVHTAWANSADGSTDFSTTVSAGKQYLGVYTDNTAADSQRYQDYSWSLIKGAKGDAGEDGVGISSIVEQYYLSTSSTTQSGGSWSTNQPAWTSGKYIWTRSLITWDTTPATTTTTTPVLAKAINGANETAKSASDTATQTNTALNNLKTQQAIFNLLTNNGALQGLYMSNGQLYINASYIQTGSLLADLIVAGKIQSDNGKVYFDLDNNEMVCSKILANAPWTYGSVRDDGEIAIDVAKSTYQGIGSYAYTDIYATNNADNGLRIYPPNANGSGAHHDDVVLSSLSDIIITSHTRYVNGTDDTASVRQSSSLSLQEGEATLTAVRANGSHGDANYLSVVDADDPAAGIRAGRNLSVVGTIKQTSDRRLKRHVAYLGDDAAEFMRSLRPALFMMNGLKRVGFYAQDVEAVDPWDSDIVTDEDFYDDAEDTVKMLDYTSLIAPLTAYAQRLEQRVEALETMLREATS